MAGVPTIAFVAIAGLMLAGVALLIMGWRGRRIDDHPLCRLCGYDLHGNAHAAACPECGRDLQRRRCAIRIGHRRRRWLVATAGTLMLLLALAGGGLVAWGAMRDFDWNTVKPLVILRREAVGSDVVRKQKAQSEILKRLIAGRLSQGQIDSLADQALALQADANATWDAWWGDFVEWGWSRSQVSRTRFETYLQTALDGAAYLRVRRSVHPDVRTRIDVMLPPLRAGDASTLLVNGRADALMADGRKLCDVFRGSSLQIGRQTRGVDSCVVATAQALTLPVGHHRIEMDVEFMFSDSGTATRISTQPANDNWSIRFDRRLEASVEILAADADDVRLLANPSISDRMHKSITPSLAVRQWNPGVRTLIAFVAFDQPPTKVAFDVIVREPAGQREINLGGVWATPADRYELAPWLELNDQTAWVLEAGVDLEIVLRASIPAAETTWNLYDIWDGELRYPGVAVNVESKSP